MVLMRREEQLGSKWQQIREESVPAGEEMEEHVETYGSTACDSRGATTMDGPDNMEPQTQVRNPTRSGRNEYYSGEKCREDTTYM